MGLREALAKRLVDRVAGGETMSGPAADVPWEGVRSLLGRAMKGERREIRSISLPKDLGEVNVEFLRERWGHPLHVSWNYIRDDAGDIAKDQAAALPAFRAAETEIAKELRKGPWSDVAFYGDEFYGDKPTKTRIYERMLAKHRPHDFRIERGSLKTGRNGKPTFEPGDGFVLRRRFPFRHEIAAAGAAGVFWPNDASAEQPADPLPGADRLRMGDPQADEPLAQNALRAALLRRMGMQQ